MEQVLTLSHRQLEVLSLSAQGLTRDEVGRVLHISPHTVKDHIDDARARLGARNVAHAFSICIARGYLCVDGRAECVFIPKPLELVAVAA
jgi:DNA-binding CsgD family transcriptional regulator